MVKEYEPAVLVKLPVPVYGEVPPEAVIVTVVKPPLQAIVPDDAEAVTAVGWVTVKQQVPVALLASVTVTQ